MVVIYRLIPKDRAPMTIDAYREMLDTLEKFLGAEETEETKRIVRECRWAAEFSPGFRERTRDELQSIIDEVYVRTQS